jgi:hypothetical protein
LPQRHSTAIICLLRDLCTDTSSVASNVRESRQSIGKYMGTRIQLQLEQKEDYERLRDLELAKLKAAVEYLRRSQPAPMRADRLIRAVAEGLGGQEEEAASIVRTGLMLHAWIRHGGLTVSGLQQAVQESVKVDFGWTHEQLQKWAQVEPAFGDFLGLPVLGLVAGAIDLTVEYTNLWRNCRILTDIRPIFDIGASIVEGAVISHTFRLQFENAEGFHELFLLMEESDLPVLIDHCERALKKAKTARALMQEKADVPTMVFGDDGNA